MKNTSPEQLKQARVLAGLTQEQAAQLIGVTSRMWRNYETGSHEIPAPLLKLFLLETGQHPEFRLIKNF